MVLNCGEKIALGFTSGLLGTFGMTVAQKLLSEAAQKFDAGPMKKAADWDFRQHARSEGAQAPPATIRVARKIFKATTGQELAQKQEKVAGTLVHYGMGASMGVIYSLARGEKPGSHGSGMIFGILVWLGADELAMPILKLTKPAKKFPASSHLYALLAHLSFGACTALAYRGLQSAYLPRGQRTL